MAIPQLSPEDRQAALEKAKAARIKRAQVRDDLKAGKLTLAQVVVMKELQIAESRRLRGLGERQQVALLERLG